jgi:hypothetical protein
VTAVLLMDADPGRAMPLGFLLNATEPERTARLRELRALALVFAGPDHPVTRALAAAVADPAAAPAALAELARLPALRKRRLLATFGALAR